MFTHEELKNLLVISQRTQLQGNEAIAVAELQKKLLTLVQETKPEVSEEPKKEE